jgi:hypothetical protein
MSRSGRVAGGRRVRVQRRAPGATIGTTVVGGNGSWPAANQFQNREWVAADSEANVYVADSSTTGFSDGGGVD